MINDETDGSWFLAQMRPNCSQVAERNLRQQGFRTFLPLEQHEARPGDDVAAVSRPLFPGYIFVGLDPAAGHWRKINSTHGITRLVSFGTTPAQLSPEIVGALMQQCDASGRVKPSDIRAGDIVRVTAGPLADLMATVESTAPDQRVWVLIRIMGAQTRVAITRSHLRVA